MQVKLSELVDRIFASPQRAYREPCKRAAEARSDDMLGLPPHLRGDAVREIERALHLCESPIEEVALYQLAGFNFGNDEHPARARVMAHRGEFPRGEAHIVPQVSFGRYRVDILVDWNGKLHAVECDGAAFHDAERDQRRDRELLEAHGVTVHRITGRDIWRGAEEARAIAEKIKRAVLP